MKRIIIILLTALSAISVTAYGQENKIELNAHKKSATQITEEKMLRCIRS